MLKRVHRFFHHHYRTRYHGIYKHAKQLFIFDLTLLGAALIILGTGLWLIFWKPGLATQINLTLSLGDRRLLSGAATELVISYANQSRSALSDITLGVHLPAGFIINQEKTGTEFSKQNNTFSFSALPAGGSGTKKISGWWWGEPGQEDKIAALLAFYAADTGFREQIITPFFATLSGSLISAQIATPSHAIAENDMPLEITLRNQSDFFVTSTLLSSWPITWTKKYEPIILPPQEKIILRGTARTPLSTAAAINITPQISVAGLWFKQLPTTAEVSLVAPRLELTASLAPTAPNYAEPGGQIPLEITWKNTGSIPLEHLLIKLLPTAGIVDTIATAKLNGLRRSAQHEIIISDADRTALSEAAPNAQGEIKIILQLKSHFTMGEGVGNGLTVAPQLESTVPKVASVVFKTAGAGTAVPLATDFTINAATRYFTDEGDQLGRGPLPPRLGSTTKYWIMARLTNTTNAVRAVAFETTLPNFVAFTGKQSVSIGPALRFDSASRRVSWSYFALPPESETTLAWEVALAPTADQRGTMPTLTGPLLASATDDAVGKEFKLILPALTTELPITDRGRASGNTVEE